MGDLGWIGGMEVVVRGWWCWGFVKREEERGESSGRG